VTYSKRLRKMKVLKAKKKRRDQSETSGPLMRGERVRFGRPAGGNIYRRRAKRRYDDAKLGEEESPKISGERLIGQEDHKKAVGTKMKKGGRGPSRTWGVH